MLVALLWRLLRLLVFLLQVAVAVAVGVVAVLDGQLIVCVVDCALCPRPQQTMTNHNLWSVMVWCGRGQTAQSFASVLRVGLPPCYVLVF